MLNTLSPYALLKASKPRESPTYTSSYDLYSTSVDSPSPSLPAQEAAPLNPPEPLSPQIKKTHYIADIHRRHTRASSRVQFSGGSGAISSSTSLHEPS